LILDAARLAPSARNLQPWRFVVVQGDEAIEELASAFNETNQEVRNALVIIIVCAREQDDVTGAGKPYYLLDLGLSVENLLLAATDLGLCTHSILSFDESKIQKILEIPAEYRVVLTPPLAYSVEPSYDQAAADKLGEQTRRELEEITSWGKWGRESRVDDASPNTGTPT
jgi:nitroreductase